MARLDDKAKKRLIADLSTGKYSVRTLAEKYGVSNATIQKYKDEIDPKSEQVVNAGIAYKMGLANIEDPVKVNAIVNAVEERTKEMLFFKNTALKSQTISNLALSAIHETITSEKEPKARATKAMLMLPALETHGKITERNKNIVLGKDADTKVTVNTAVQQNVQQIGEVSTQEEATRVYLDLMGKR